MGLFSAHTRLCCKSLAAAHPLAQVYIYDTYEKGSISIQERMQLGQPDECLSCCSVSMDDLYVIVGGAEGAIFSWDTERCGSV